jgi:hypothetical protein
MRFLTFLPEWIHLGLNVNRFWFLDFYNVPSILDNYLKFWYISGSMHSYTGLKQKCHNIHVFAWHLCQAATVKVWRQNYFFLYLVWLAGRHFSLLFLKTELHFQQFHKYINMYPHFLVVERNNKEAGFFPSFLRALFKGCVESRGKGSSFVQL